MDSLRVFYVTMENRTQCLLKIIDCSQSGILFSLKYYISCLCSAISILGPTFIDLVELLLTFIVLTDILKFPVQKS